MLNSGKVSSRNLEEAAAAAEKLLEEKQANEGVNQATECDKSKQEGNSSSLTIEKQQQQQQTDEYNVTQNYDDDEEESESPVIPAWPSRGDHNAQMARSKLSSSKKGELVQHQVYSLRDYSQVAAPNEPVANSEITQSSKQTSQPASPPAYPSKLVKSLSQERKAANLKGKRMSECFYPPHPLAALSQARANQQVDVTTNRANHTSSGESRIERVRKLFVAPLSLSRSSASASSLGFKRTPPVGSGPASSLANCGASASPRLSLQSGSTGGMLNKPHQQLLQAVYAAQRGSSSGRQQSGRASKNSPKGSATKGSFQVYGCPLQLANNIYPITCFGRPDVYKQQSVPYVLARLCIYIEENSSHLTHEGIFRVSGNARLMDKLKTLFDHLGDAPLELESVDVATSASMLKMYLRELPEPLIPTRLNYYFITLAKKYSVFLASTLTNNIGGISNKQQQHDSAPGIAAEANSNHSISGSESSKAQLNERQKISFSRDLIKLLRKLPLENYNLLKYLACFLYRVSLKQQYNKMCAEALGIVFGPNVFRIRSESYKGLKEQELSNQIMASIISNYKNVFDSELTDPLGNLIGDVCADDTPEVDPTQPIPMNSSKAIKGESAEHTSSLPVAVPSTCRNGQMNGEREIGPKISDTLSKSNKMIDDTEHSDDLHVAISNDEECDEDESYTPSSGSESYCSLVDSDSLESSYAERNIEDIDDEVQDDENDEIEDEASPTTDLEDEDEHSSGDMTSSDCLSDTSYTPITSQSLEGSDVDMPNSVEFNDLVDANSHSSCMVCAQRKSASFQLDQNNSKVEDANQKPRSKEEVKNMDTKSANNKIISIENGDKNCDHKSNRVAFHPSERTQACLSCFRKPKESLVLDSSEQETQLVEQVLDCPRRQSWSVSSTNRATRWRRGQLTTLRRSHHTSDRRSNRFRRVRATRSNLVAPGTRRFERDQQLAIRRSLRPAQVGVVSEPSRCSSSSGRSFLAGDGVSSLTLDSSIPHEVINLLKSSRGEVRSTTCIESSNGYSLLRTFNSDYTLLRNHYLISSDDIGNIKSMRRHSSDIRLLREMAMEKDRSELKFEYPIHPGGDSSTIPETSASSSSEDSIQVQIEATRTLARSFKRLRRLGESYGYTREMELLIEGLVDSPSSESNYWLSCFVDHLTAIQLASQIEKQLLEARSANRGDITRSSLRSVKLASSDVTDTSISCPAGDVQEAALSAILALKIGSLMQRYWDLKNIRDHNLKNHTSQLLLGQKSWLRHVQESYQKPTHSNHMSLSADSLAAELKEKYKSVKNFESEPLSAEEEEEGRVDHGGSKENLSKIGANCWFGALCPVEFVCGIERRLATRRRLAHREIPLNEMSPDQLAGEKLELQKNLLRYEHWFGRPARKLEASLVGHIYERYRTVKLLRQVVENHPVDYK